MADLLLLDDGTLIDPESGEILREGTKAAEPSEYLAYLSLQMHEAGEQQKAWEVRKKTLSRITSDMAARQGVSTFEAEDLKFTRYSGWEGKRSDPSQVLSAVNAEVMNHDQAASLLLRATKTLDAKEVEAWIGEQPEDTQKVLRALLIQTYRVPGHMRSSPQLRDGTRGIVSREVAEVGL